ncbi:hypothetical protein KC726_05925 [Candidatus Woesebacteria bacterium]|nr:hypothetical protein [Candidatus Woesebacteria bacterium]
MIFCITGQTATGKTRKAIELADEYNGELINCDARQLYRGIDIVTGKDLDLTTHTYNLWKQVENVSLGYYRLKGETGTKLWLYDAVDLTRPFSAYEYRTFVLTIMKEIIDCGKAPIVVGGTYFYMHNLLYGSVDERIEPDWKLRKKLEKRNVVELQNLLKKLDARLFKNLSKSEQYNRQRLIRRIEKRMQPTKKIFSQSLKDVFPTNKVLVLGMKHATREETMKRVEVRVRKRIRMGAIEEIQKFLSKGYIKNDPGLKTIGCTQIIKYLQGETTREEMEREWITKEVQYAKRQLTFMKRDKHIEWID